MQWMDTVKMWMEWFATRVPLELFVIVGSFLEELVGPIPSTLVMTTAGVFAKIEGRTLLFAVWLAMLGAAGKTLGAWLYYVLGDKLEDVAVRRFGGYLGIEHQEIERIGAYFGRNHWKDGSILFFLRLIPFLPSTAISVVCGIVKIHPHVYVPITWAGSFGKDLLYVYTGYAGISMLHRLWQDAERMRWGLDLFLGAVLFGLIWFAYRHRDKVARFFDRVLARFE